MKESYKKRWMANPLMTVLISGLGSDREGLARHRSLLMIAERQWSRFLIVHARCTNKSVTAGCQFLKNRTSEIIDIGSSIV